MAWTLHFLVWITVVTASAYKCKHAAYSSSDSGTRYPHDYANQESIGIPDSHISPGGYSSNVPDGGISAQLRVGEPKAESRQGESTDTSKIVFPGPTSEEFRLEIPEHCKKIGICEDVPNYPTEQVKKVLSELSDLDVFQDDKPDLPDLPDITQRVGPQEENIELCQFEERLLYPKAAIDASGNWHVVLQGDDPTQGFKVEICKNQSENDDWQSSEGKWEDSPACSGIAVFVSGYEGRCKQKFVYRKMSVLQDGTKLERSLKVPSCCSCVARLVLS